MNSDNQALQPQKGRGGDAILEDLRQMVRSGSAMNPNRINTHLLPYPESVDMEDMKAVFSFEISPDQTNFAGTSLHGGLTGVIMDNAMGYFSAYLAGGMNVTVNMNTSYLRPVPIDRRLFVKVFTEKRGREFNYMSAYAYNAEEPDRHLVNATGVYYILPKKGGGDHA